MTSKLVLLSNLLLASVVLADSSLQLEALLARNDNSDPQFLPIQNFHQSIDGASGNLVTDSESWAGAIWIKDVNTFNGATGTLVVPHAVGPDGSAVSFSLSLDGGNPNSCNDAFAAIGVAGQVFPGGVVAFYGWLQWYPEHPSQNLGIDIEPGHRIKLTISLDNLISATFRIENLDNYQFVVRGLMSTRRLCGATVAWIIEKPLISGMMPPLMDFGLVVFSSASATSFNNMVYTPLGAILVNLYQDRYRTFVSVSELDRSLSILYLP